MKFLNGVSTKHYSYLNEELSIMTHTHIHTTPLLRRWRQEDFKFQVSLSYVRDPHQRGREGEGEEGERDGVC